jgi:hypothetical protein
VLATADSHPPVPEPGKKENLAALRLKDLPQIIKERQCELRKVRRAMIFECNIHRLADAERHVRGAGYRKTLESWHLQLPLINL